VSILDEVQRAPDLFSYIQSLVDRDDVPGRYILSGSQNFLLLRSIGQSLAPGGTPGMDRTRNDRQMCPSTGPAASSSAPAVNCSDGVADVAVSTAVQI